MMKINKIGLFLLTVATLVASTKDINAQQTTGDKILEANTITTAVPFLRINPDARSGAMGDVGMATSPDANAVFSNASKLAFIEQDYGVSLTFVPWLRNLANDVYMADIAAFYKIKKQTLATSIRYFSLGDITLTDNIGTTQGETKPREFAIDLHYARQLSKKFSMGIGLRYIYSKISVPTAQNDINPGMAMGADLSMFYTTPLKVKKMEGVDLNFGLAFTNIGSKMTYTSNAQEKDFIPTNLGFGLGADMQIDEFNRVGIYFDINKLLVPTPIPDDELYEEKANPNDQNVIKPEYDEDDNNIPDYKEKSSIGGLFTSFGDAPGGFSEELKEYMLSVGAEYTYNDLFAVRLGYFYEPPTKGNRKFLSAGAGITYSVATINFAYLIPTSSNRNPLDNTMRFSLLFNFDKGGKVEETEGIELN